MEHASLFSGIGGPEVAASMLGWENVFHCEINPFGRAVLDYWFPNSESYEDITKTDFTKYRGQVDVLTGGFPCQPFSYAGKRGGQQDQRYLWPEMLRVINEVRPTWVIGENVAGIGTMVEQCRITDLGSEATLFEKGGGLHRYTAEYTFTIERICSDLESKGYSVQPMLIPACAVGAPHRRDRIFFIAHYTDSCNDLRESGQHESESGKERLSERNEVRKPGESSDVRPANGVTVEDTLCDGCSGRQEKEQGDKWDIRNVGTGDRKRLCGKERIVSADSDSRRLERTSKRIRKGRGNDAMWQDRVLLPEERWKGFPSVSPVHRGNDGLPFYVDNLTISFAKWRTESLKAYGNAIVPQVMYRIFQCIENVKNQKSSINKA